MSFWLFFDELSVNLSFPRSAWECPLDALRPGGSSGVVTRRGASGMRYHTERGNDEKSVGTMKIDER
jgi:hypothetical protein